MNDSIILYLLEKPELKFVRYPYEHLYHPYMRMLDFMYDKFLETKPEYQFYFSKRTFDCLVMPLIAYQYIPWLVRSKLRFKVRVKILELQQFHIEYKFLKNTAIFTVCKNQDK